MEVHLYLGLNPVAHYQVKTDLGEQAQTDFSPRAHCSNEEEMNSEVQVVGQEHEKASGESFLEVEAALVDSDPCRGQQYHGALHVREGD